MGAVWSSANAAYDEFAVAFGPPPAPPQPDAEEIPEGFARDTSGSIVDILELEADDNEQANHPGQRLQQMRQNFNPETVRKSAKADDTRHCRKHPCYHQRYLR